MTQTLATLPSSHRAPFSRVQASIRAAYHRSVNARKTAEFRAHLAATQPGGSLLPHNRVKSLGPEAKKERYERVDHFIRTWCTAGMPGTKPFFQSLWAIMRLQVVPDKLGGAGKFRIEWEIDDAVFKEAAGKDFMLDAVDVLKGVLAFEETPASRIASATSGCRFSNIDTIHSRSKSLPLSSDNTPVSLPLMAKRPRAPSDPFLDTPNTHSVPTSSHAADTHPQDKIDNADVTPTAGRDTDKYPHGTISLDEEEEEEDDYLRIWTSPDLPNSEFLELLKVFPPFISRSPLPRFPTTVRIHDLEEGDDGGTEERQIHFGTGSFWVSCKERSDGWQGGWWSRFILWWRSTFC